METICESRTTLSKFVVAAACLTLIGCSATKSSNAALARAEMAVRAARDSGAGEASSLDLKRAQEKLEAAKKALAAGRQAEARRLAESAQVDAELAEVKAETEILRRAADHLQQRVDAIQSDAERESRKPLTSLPSK